MLGLPQMLVLIFCAACIFGLVLEAHGAAPPAAAESRTDPVEGAPPLSLSLSLSLLCIRTKWYLNVIK